MKKIIVLFAILSLIACKNENKVKSNTLFIALDKTNQGNPSPKFVNYENFNGGTTSLDDLKGKYVYVDVWATWCGPCKAEIPSLKEIAQEYSDKDIAFVSISVDDVKDHDKWKNMVADKQLKGVQLFANGDTQFVKEYGIKSIPRFILIDKKGNIIDYDTYRPSDSDLRIALNALLY